MSEREFIVIQKTEPNECGGTDAVLDKNAPKEILSEDMILFSAASALGFSGNHPDVPGYISAFAAPTPDGTFLFLESGDHCARGERREEWALVKENVFPSLVTLVRECGLAKNNGYYSTTHGLPENFGGSVDIQYKSGERISFSDNQTPVLTPETGKRILGVFARALRGERVPLPDVSALSAIRFEKTVCGGGYTEAVLKINPDGTGVNEKRSRRGDPAVYESAKHVGAETVAAIKKKIELSGMLAWEGLPESGYSSGGGGKLEFVFEGGRIVTVKDGKVLPDRLRGAFFGTELEI